MIPPSPLIVQPGVSPPVPGDPAGFFEAVAAAFEQARAAAGGIDRYFTMAGHPLRLSLAGPGLLARLTPALAHLAIPPVPEPALTIGLWDAESTGVAAPPPAWAYEDFQANGAVRGFDAGQVRVFFQFGINAVSAIHLARNQGYYWVKSAEQIPTYESGSPLRPLLHQWLSQRGVMLVHAGAVGEADGGVLLVGQGGSGKSNTALSMLTSSLCYASDDYCLVQVEPEARAFSLYSTGKTQAGDLARLPFLRPAISNPDGLDTEKALYFLHDHFPDRLIQTFPIRAIIMPLVTGETDSRLRPASAAAALKALAPSTIQQLPGVGAADVRLLIQLARQTPSYVLELGTDLSQPPRLIQSLLRILNPADQPAPGPG